MTKKCHRRSWLQLNFMLLAMVELFSQRVLGDQGWTGRDAWDDAQATGKIEVQAQQISMQSYATAMWGWAFQRAMYFLGIYYNFCYVTSTLQLYLVHSFPAFFFLPRRKMELAESTT